MNLCDNCIGSIKARAFGVGKCVNCDKKFMCQHIPVDNYCHQCTVKKNICKSCGKNLNDE